MAAYAALVSVMQTIDQIHRHPRPPISLHKQHSESLTKIVIFLQDFLENYNPHHTYTAEEDPLESRIAEAAYAVEDVIESYIVDQIHARLTNDRGTITPVQFYQGLQKVIGELDLIKMEILEMKEKNEFQIKRAATVSNAGSFKRSNSVVHKVGMIGFDDVLYQMLENVTRGRLRLEIIPIVGMGGIGKTTLARHVYADPLVEQYFDLRAWSTISQDYDAVAILRQVLDQVGKGYTENLNEYELGDRLYKTLIGRRYLIVMDDMWSIEAWDILRNFFPDKENGSRVVITTRLSNLASMFNFSSCIDMKFLDEANSWDLFSKTVFGEEICPVELEEVGKKIVRGCRGLPLSISVVGGLLSRIGQTQENWRLIEENLNSVVNLEDKESCLQILYMSYNNLPVHVKPCFLYIGVFPEDDDILAALLIMLWVAEGFIKPCGGKSLEEAGRDYLEELVDRNLIIVECRDNCGNLVSFKIHDLLRDLSLREAQKLKFLHVWRGFGEDNIHDVSLRRIGSKIVGPPSTLIQSVESTSLVRSLIGNFGKTLPHSFSLLRVAMSGTYFEEKSIEKHEGSLVRLVNLRFLLVDVGMGFLSRVPSSVSLLWNLQTIIFSHASEGYIFQIWKLPQLRHVMSFGGRLEGAYFFPSADSDMHTQTDEVVMENLKTLLMVKNLCLGEEVVKRIPNIITLDLYYDETPGRDRGSVYQLGKLSRLQRLETLSLEYACNIQKHALTHLITFPDSLKELELKRTKLYWREMQTKVGMLPNLQILHLNVDSCVGAEWETFEGQFCSLRVLVINDCGDLEYWMTESTHFPRLEELDLHSLYNLIEIPASIGDIPTLRLMKLDCSSASAVDSARRIQEEQETLGNEELQIQIG